MSDVRTGWKVLTHHLYSPIQAGPQIFDGTLPFTTPAVKLDVSAICGSAQ